MVRLGRLLKKIPVVRGYRKLLGKKDRKGHHKAKQHAPGKRIGHGRDKGKGTESFKIPQGKKYLRLQRFESLSPQQKKILKKFGQHVKPQEMKFPKGAEKASKFLQRAMKYGAPVSPLERVAGRELERGMQANNEPSPLESAGSSHLQNLLQQNPEEHYRDYAEPIMSEFYEQTIPSIAERFTAAGGQKNSAFQQALGAAGAGLRENLGALKARLIDQMVGRQSEAANIGLGYNQLPNQREQTRLNYINQAFGYSQGPERRFGQQVNIAPSALNAALMPQQSQEEARRFAANQQFQQRQQVVGTQPWGMLSVPPKGKQPGFWQGFAPRALGGLAGAGLGSMVGMPMQGAMLGASIGGGVAPSINMNMNAPQPAPAIGGQP